MNEPYRPQENTFQRVGPVYDRTYRKKVPGGWLVKIDEYYSTKTTWGAICFYPDPNHEWKDLAECADCSELVDVADLMFEFGKHEIIEFNGEKMSQDNSHYICESCHTKQKGKA